MRTTWLVDGEGLRVAVRAAGLLIGRGPHCDIVLTDVGASRVQAVAFAAGDGASLAVLGKGLTLVNGEPVRGDHTLQNGDRIELPGLSLAVCEDVTQPAPVTSSWVLRGPRGLFGLVRTPFTVGSRADADLRIEDGPPEILRFLLTDRLHVEPLSSIAIDGVTCEPGEIHAVRPGTVVHHRTTVLEIVAGGAIGMESTASADDPGPTSVRLEFLARGGRLTVRWGTREATVYLPDRRCNLIATLLQPPRPFAAGEPIPDDVLLGRVWPGRTSTRVDLNVLLHRARHDLVRASLDASLLLRADGGNATSFRLARGASVEVE